MIELRKGALPRKPYWEWPEPRIMGGTVKSSIDVLSSDQDVGFFPIVPFREKLRLCECGNSGTSPETVEYVQEVNDLVGLICKNCKGVIKYWWLESRNKEV